MVAVWSFVVVLIVAVIGTTVTAGSLSVDHDTKTGWSTSEGGCSSRHLCCQGKNNTCRVDGPRVSNSDSFTCFCDSACFELGDCCTDYKTTCQSVDCEVGPWQEWGECDVRCGPGVKQRSRPVTVQPLNGGQPCPPTVEKTTCDGTRCKYPRALAGLDELRETGKILPAVFGTWRYDKKYSPYSDIRKNLFNHYDSKLEPNMLPSYCAEYEVIDAKPGCQSLSSAAPWTRPLIKGAVACVECQSVAMRRRLGNRCRGHGVLGKQTRWNAATARGCSGRWKITSARRQCRCNPNSQLSFIFI